MNSPEGMGELGREKNDLSLEDLLMVEESEFDSRSLEVEEEKELAGERPMGC